MAKVLVIDDSNFQRQWLVKAIKRMGHETTEAENGLVGLERILVDQPECIVSDLLMPEMDGIQLMENLAEQNNKIPVIIVTADIQTGTRQQCQDLGARAVLNKPFKDSDLKAAIAVCLSEA